MDPSNLPLSHFMPGGFNAEEGFTARAGTPLADPKPALASRDDLVEALRTVFDPEIPVNIYDLGLIYDIQQNDDGSVAIEMTLTAPGCPVAGEMPGQVAEAVAKADGVGEVEVTLTWEPAWTQDRMSEDAKLALGLF
ncbi:MAG: SUF system Fe-S cluster assembly protein [Pseudomonadota bacterium]